MNNNLKITDRDLEGLSVKTPDYNGMDFTQLEQDSQLSSGYS